MLYRPGLKNEISNVIVSWFWGIRYFLDFVKTQKVP